MQYKHILCDFVWAYLIDLWWPFIFSYQVYASV